MVQYTIRAYNAAGDLVYQWMSGPVQEWEKLEQQIGKRIGIGTHPAAEVSDALYGRGLNWDAYDLAYMLWDSVDKAGPNGRIEVLP